MSRQQLQEISIQGFKSFKHQDLQLSSMNILIGQNGAGKSNFISIFHLIRYIVEGKLKLYSQRKGVESILYYGLKETQRIRISLSFKPFYYTITLETATSQNIFFIQNEVVSNYPNEDFSFGELIQVSMFSEESQIVERAKEENFAKTIYESLHSIRVYHFHDTTETAGVKGYSSITDNRFLFEDASNLPSFLYRMKLTGAAYYERIVKTVQLVMPFFKDFLLEPNFQNVETIRLEWQDKYSDKVFTAHDLSDGSLRFICMATLLLQEMLPSVVLLDEPEIGLHPSASTILAGLLKKASKRTQVIVSTQSVSLVNEFDAEDIVVVERPAEETIMRRLDADKLSAWLEEYSLGDLWDKNVLGGNP